MSFTAHERLRGRKNCYFHGVVNPIRIQRVNWEHPGVWHCTTRIFSFKSSYSETRDIRLMAPFTYQSGPPSAIAITLNTWLIFLSLSINVFKCFRKSMLVWFFQSVVKDKYVLLVGWNVTNQLLGTRCYLL